MFDDLNAGRAMAEPASTGELIRVPRQEWETVVKAVALLTRKITALENQLARPISETRG